MYVENLKKLRKKLRYSIDELASLLDIPSRTLGGYERNERVPSIDLAVKLKNKLNVNLNWLVSGEGQMFNAPKFEEIEDDIKTYVVSLLEKAGAIK